MYKQKLMEAVSKTKDDINDEIDSFISKIESSTENPENFISMSKLESEWRSLQLSTHKKYSELVASAMSSMDTKDVHESKKANSSRME